MTGVLFSSSHKESPGFTSEGTWEKVSSSQKLSGNDLAFENKAELLDGLMVFSNDFSKRLIGNRNTA